MPLSEDAIREALKNVIDPELFVNIVDLGMIHTIELRPADEQRSDVKIELVLTSPMCPAGPRLVAECKQTIESLEGAGLADVQVVLNPPWTPDRMTDEARDQLNIF